jgi:hypothetical protein
VLDLAWPDKYAVTNEEKAAYGLIDMGDVARVARDTFGGGPPEPVCTDFEAMQRAGWPGLDNDNP